MQRRVDFQNEVRYERWIEHFITTPPLLLGFFFFSFSFYFALSMLFLLRWMRGMVSFHDNNGEGGRFTARQNMDVI